MKILTNHLEIDYKKKLNRCIFTQFKKTIFTSTDYDYLYFLWKLIANSNLYICRN